MRGMLLLLMHNLDGIQPDGDIRRTESSQHRGDVNETERAEQNRFFIGLPGAGQEQPPDRAAIQIDHLASLSQRDAGAMESNLLTVIQTCPSGAYRVSTDGGHAQRAMSRELTSGGTARWLRRGVVTRLAG